MTLGLNPLVLIGTGAVSAAPVPLSPWLPRQDSDLDLTGRKPSVLTVRLRGILESRFRGRSFAFVGCWERPLPYRRPSVLGERAGGSYSPSHDHLRSCLMDNNHIVIHFNREMVTNQKTACMNGLAHVN